MFSFTPRASLSRRQRVLEYDDFAVCGIADIYLVAIIGGYTMSAFGPGSEAHIVEASRQE